MLYKSHGFSCFHFVSTLDIAGIYQLGEEMHVVLKESPLPLVVIKIWFSSRIKALMWSHIADGSVIVVGAQSRVAARSST